MPLDQKALTQLLAFAVQNTVSDIHFRAGSAPSFRMKGELNPVKTAAFSDQDMVELCKVMLASDPSQIEKLPTLKDFDGSFDIPNLCRFRFNIFRNGGKLGAVLRVIPAKIPSIEDLGLPPVLKKIAENERGLVLVTGATGSGKSSTLAAMINHINEHHSAHILTIEDPVEFMHPQKKSRITQREIGRDTNSFSVALRAALRQDPDVILVGEMRDPETVDIALKAAETGHVVFSTVHTTDAAKTIGRLVSMFPPAEQNMVRLRLADCLMGTVSQRLLRRADGKGRVVAQEIMIANRGIQDCIMDPNRTGEINDFIMKSADLIGGQTFEMHLVKLYRAKLISLETAKEASTNPADFERNLMYGSNSSESAPTESTGGDPGVQLDTEKAS